MKGYSTLEKNVQYGWCRLDKGLAGLLCMLATPDKVIRLREPDRECLSSSLQEIQCTTFVSLPA